MFHKVLVFILPIGIPAASKNNNYYCSLTSNLLLSHKKGDDVTENDKTFALFDFGRNFASLMEACTDDKSQNLFKLDALWIKCVFICRLITADCHSTGVAQTLRVVYQKSFIPFLFPSIFV